MAEKGKLRERFEAWARNQGTVEQGWWIRQLPDGGYSSGVVDSAWLGWQAAMSSKEADSLSVSVECVTDESGAGYAVRLDLGGRKVYSKWKSRPSSANKLAGAIADAFGLDAISGEGEHHEPQ